MKKNYEKIREQVRADEDLGKIPDDELGRRYGVSKTFVCKTRNKYGIKFQWKRTPGPSRKSPETKKVLSYKHLLGVYSDLSIAPFIGVHKETVRRVRVELGIPPAPHRRLTYVPVSHEQNLIDSWKCIPERVGLTKNEWRKQCALN